MNRREFMDRLEELLQDISQRERVEALAYYNDYFDDAGEENEQQVISSLGSPEKVAATIKEGLGEKTASGNEGTVVTSGDESYNRPSQSTDWGKIILIILLCIVLSPILIPLGGVMISVIVAVPVTFFGVLVAVGVGGIGILIAGVVMAVFAIAKLFTSAAAGLSLLGLALLCLGAGTLGIVAAVWIGSKVIPWLIRAIVRLFSKPFEKRR